MSLNLVKSYREMMFEIFVTYLLSVAYPAVLIPQRFVVSSVKGPSRVRSARQRRVDSSAGAIVRELDRLDRRTITLSKGGDGAKSHPSGAKGICERQDGRRPRPHRRRSRWVGHLRPQGVVTEGDDGDNKTRPHAPN